MELYAYASELFAKKRVDPHDDLMSVLTQGGHRREQLSPFELELFFLLLPWPATRRPATHLRRHGHVSSRNPRQWSASARTRSLLPDAVEECSASSPR